jgi:hypothetical protein
MSYRIFTSLTTLLLSFFYFESIVAMSGQTYEEYIKEAGAYCDDTTQSWWTGNTLVPKIDYPELSSKSVNATLTKWKDNNPKWMVGEEKSRLRADLDPVTIGEYSWFKSLEVARIGYRSNMNALFACAVISSRIEILTDLQELISKKINPKNSEILKDLEKKGKKLWETASVLKCNPVKKTEMMIGLVNTATHQYCHYRHYLNYLDSNITANLRDTQEIERRIWLGSGTQIATNTNEWANISPRYPKDLAGEIVRADTTLPKAIKSLQEMDQTYGAHILLTLIYDDYIRLRKTLSAYMNQSSQLYQKAYNAQSTNK